MLNMLKFEFRRLTRKPSFYIMLGLCVGVAVFMVFSIRGSMNYMITHMNDLDSYYNESYVKEYFEKQKLEREQRKFDDIDSQEEIDNSENFEKSGSGRLFGKSKRRHPNVDGSVFRSEISRK